MSPFLRVLENEVQIAALAFLAVVYGVRIVWLFKFRMPREQTFPAGSRAAGAGRSLMNILMPWAMESVRRNPGFYIQFAAFHLGVAAAIMASLIIPYRPSFFRSGTVVLAFRAAIGTALVVGLVRLARRITNPAVRLISTVDDYLSLCFIILFLSAGYLAVAHKAGQAEWPPILFFGLTALLLVYVPFSKIGHYLYYPFSRVILGGTLGHRGAMASGSAKKGAGRRNGRGEWVS
jgi:hypothetical protein